MLSVLFSPTYALEVSGTRLTSWQDPDWGFCEDKSWPSDRAASRDFKREGKDCGYRID